MNAIELKERLNGIYENPLQLKEDEILSLTHPMLAHLGTTDPELRDHLIYSLFTTWIEHKRIPENRMKEILRECLTPQYLFLGIGERDTDTVFTRSFAVLIITCILSYHNDLAPFLESEEIDQVKESILHYAFREKDFRGFVPEKGWAHSIAHLADSLEALSLCNQVDQEDLKQILDLIYQVIRIREFIFMEGEDERMVRATLAIIKKNCFTEEFILDWINRLSILDWREQSPTDYWHAKNIKNFLRSLYFQTLEQDELVWLKKALLNSLNTKKLAFI